MRSLIIAFCIIGYVYATSDEEAKVLRSDYSQSPEGDFSYAYETENGISGQAQGKVKSLGKDEIALEVSGSSQYKSPEGEVVSLTYIADENGYQPQGSHLPTTPAPLPVPEHILRALAYIAEHPYKEPVKP